MYYTKVNHEAIPTINIITPRFYFSNINICVVFVRIDDKVTEDQLKMILIHKQS